MAGNPLNNNVINQQSAADARYLYEVYEWCKRRLLQWSTNVPNTQALAALGVTGNVDQQELLQLQAMLVGLVAYLEGSQTVANQTSFLPLLAELQGVNW